MKKKTLLICLFVIFLALFLTGCSDLISDSDLVIYTAHPTKVRYTISYGYFVNISGTGDYDLTYECDLPALLDGTAHATLLHQADYEDKVVQGNEIVSWTIESSNENSYELGILADIETETNLVSDLSGKNAQNISDISPYVKAQYTETQSMDDVVYIDPDDATIKSLAQNILAQTDGENSFVVAKELFIWLKENTNYQAHVSTDDSVQTAIETYQKKSGDCDDLSILYISLCRSLNIPARMIRGYLIEKVNDQISKIPHAWTEVFVGGNIGNDGWITVECACVANSCEAQVNQNFGIESADHLRLFVGYGSNESLNASMSGPRILYDETLDISMESFVDVTNYEVVESKELVIDGANRYYQ